MPSKLLRWLFSKWFFVTYFALGLVYYLSLPLILGNLRYRDAAFQTVGLMTGSDPFTFSKDIETNVFVWLLAWLIHLLSWLLIPALIALVVTDARDEIQKTQRLNSDLARLAAEAGFNQEEIPVVLKELNSEMEKILAEIRTGGKT